MPTALESRAALNLVANESVATTRDLFLSLDGDPGVIRYQLLETVPAVIGYYANGTAALAADFYDETRQAAAVSKPFDSKPVVLNRVVKIRRAIAWSSEPLFMNDDRDAAFKRLQEVVQYETARPYRDTVLTNRHSDNEAIGWQRVTHGGCPMCRMLAARGAVYSKSTAGFASHPHCSCTIAPVFRGQDPGPEASVMQYLASRHNRTPAQREQLRGYLEAFYGDN